jgi:DNA polymerase I-like protein with 3'-5' exonuclease and polymerase domains
LNLSAFDLETSGTLPEYALQPWRVRQGKAWITSFVAARRGPDGQPEIEKALLGQPMLLSIKSFLRGALERRERVAGWNLAFDIAWLLALDDEELTALVFETRWLDGMLLWRHATIEPEYDTDRSKKKSYGLKLAVAERWPEHAGYEDDVDFHATDIESLRKLESYNTRDTIFTLRLTWHWWRQLEPAQQRAALIEASTLPLIAQANLEGLPVDVLAVKELEQHLTDVADQQLEILAPHGVTEKVVRSPKQLERLMFDEWKLPVFKENVGKKTGNVSRSTDKEVLHELSFLDGRAKDLRTYREALNNRTKFAVNILESVDYNEDGCTHPLAIPFGTYTSRLTYASKQGKNKDERQIGFALHQEKRDAKYRAAVAAPEGHTLVEFDASGQEYRWMAIASGDETMLGLCMPGEDPHAYMGAHIAGLDYRWLQANAKSDDHAGNMRQMGKVGNLSCISAGTQILTNRGPVPIEQVRLTDRVWDGVDFVYHAGIVYQGKKQVITYDGLTATPDHRVLVGERWVEFGQAQAHGWRIARSGGPNVWPVDGPDSGGRYAEPRALRDCSMRVRDGEAGELEVCRDWALNTVQAVPVEAGAPVARTVHPRDTGRPAHPEARECDAAAVHEPEGFVVAQLRRAGDRISVRLGGRRDQVDQDAPAAPYIPAGGHRPDRQQRALRAGQSASGDAQREPSQPQTAHVYDILDCGPRNRFVANGLIVHNCQYRVSAKKLLSVARVQYEMPLMLDQARLIHATYPRVYPGVKSYWRTQIALARRLGYVETFAGRRVQLVGQWNEATEWQMGSTAINYRIQGTGGDQKYLALSVLKPYLREHGVRFAWDLHDGIYFFVPDNKLQQVARGAKAILNNLPYERAWDFKPPIPLPWDCKYGKSWGTMKEMMDE